MRKFTKEHNELLWLFPNCDTEEDASKMFDEVEKDAEYYFENAGHKDNDTFTKDDMIDSFMKGYSIATQIFASRIHQLEQMLKAEEMMNNSAFDKISKLVEKLSTQED